MTTYGVPPRVAFVIPESDPAQVFLMQVPRGHPLVLTGSTAVIWLLAADGADDVVEAVKNVLDVGSADVDREVTSCLEGLVSRGLLTVQVTSSH